MRRIRIEKVILHSCIGTSGEKLEKGAKILESIAGQKPAIRKAKKRIRDFGIHKKEPIACMVTLRGGKAEKILKKLFEAKNKVISSSSLDKYGNFSFGIEEHIEIPGMKYDPNLGVIGLDVTVNFDRPGFRVKKRKIKRSRVPEKHRVTKNEVIKYLKKMGVTVKA